MASEVACERRWSDQGLDAHICAPWYRVLRLSHFRFLRASNPPRWWAMSRRFAGADTVCEDGNEIGAHAPQPAVLGSQRRFTISQTCPNNDPLNDVHSQLNPGATASHRIATFVVRVAGCHSGVPSAEAARFRWRVAATPWAGSSSWTTQSIWTDGNGFRTSHGCRAWLLRIEAGAMWPAIIAATHAMRDADGQSWGIRQKQTGVDSVTLGGSISPMRMDAAWALRP